MKTPVAVFCYKRPDHVNRLLESLSQCERIEETDITYYCDGPKKEEDIRAVEKTRAVVQKWQRRLGGDLIFQPENQGLSHSIIKGADELCRTAGRVIVLEDDLILNRGFLNFHLRALDHYEYAENVWQIAGFSFRIDPPAPNESYFLPISSTWGWSTWERSWSRFDPPSITVDSTKMDVSTAAQFDVNNTYSYGQMLADSLSGRNGSWGIRWYWRVFSNNGVVLYPPASLVYNMGYDGSGVHCNAAATTWQPSRHEVLKARNGGNCDFPAVYSVQPSQREELQRVLSAM